MNIPIEMKCIYCNRDCNGGRCYFCSKTRIIVEYSHYKSELIEIDLLNIKIALIRLCLSRNITIIEFFNKPYEVITLNYLANVSPTSFDKFVKRISGLQLFI